MAGQVIASMTGNNQRSLRLETGVIVAPATAEREDRGRTVHHHLIEEIRESQQIYPNLAERQNHPDPNHLRLDKAVEAEDRVLVRKTAREVRLDLEEEMGRIQDRDLVIEAGAISRGQSHL